MNIKTITCHCVFNYGASLQAYALQHYLEQQGHQVEIIDYMPDYYRDRYNIWYINNITRKGKFFNKYPFLKFPLIPLKNWYMIRTRGRKRAFLKFEKDFMHITARQYETIDDLRRDPPDADIYIVGSDQVWNTDMQNGQRPPFYLDFGAPNIQRVSYAASFGIPLVRKEYVPFVKKQLQNLSKISVREQSGLLVLESLGIRNGVQVMDPVFLLNTTEWSLLADKAKDYGLADNGYILVYDFEHTNPKVQTLVNKLAKQRRLPIVSVNDHKPLSYADKNIYDAGPLEFLTLIQHASAVVCNSFHGTAISIIFQKEFYVFPLQGQRNSERMTDLLDSLGIRSRFELETIVPIDYSTVAPLLQKNREKSMDYLRSIQL